MPAVQVQGEDDIVKKIRDHVPGFSLPEIY